MFIFLGGPPGPSNTRDDKGKGNGSSRVGAEPRRFPDLIRTNLISSAVPAGLILQTAGFHAGCTVAIPGQGT